VIDLGGSVADTYDSAEVMTINSYNNYTYGLDSFEFGIIYSTNEVASS